MKNQKIKFLSLTHLFKPGFIQEAMVSLGNSIELPALFKRIGWRVIFTLFSSKGNVAYRLKVLYNFGSYILFMKKKHGPTYVVNYLKCSQLAIQKAIAKDKISSLRELNSSYSFPRLSSSGLPRYIPLRDRRSIMNKSTSIIRFWLTLYSVYRIINIPGKLKLETISGPLTVPVSQIQSVSFDLKILVLRFKKKFNLSIVYQEKGLLLLESSSPTRVISWLGIVSDPFALARAGLGKTMLDFLYGMKYSKLLDQFVTILRYPLLDKYIRKDLLKEGVDRVGQLSTKVEAAGKIRVFALVDVWTQSALKPLHDMLFDFLKSLPNDGTFDQTSSWKRAAVKGQKAQCSFGYDLSAATDRLPIDLQVSILEPLIGDDMAKLWRDLLVKRDYWLKSEDGIWGNGVDNTPLRYAVGQPMGALSSWGMLAVTHHFLVQLAHRRAYNLIISDWFDNYELLGDDIIIFDKLVATNYLDIMQEIGVPINVSKSVVAANSVTEFAKVTTLDGVNVSALSWKMFISQNTIIGRVNILYSLLNKDYWPPGIGFEVWISSVFSKNRFRIGNLGYSLLPLLSMFAKSGRVSWETAIKSLISPEHNDRSLYKNIVMGVNRSYLVNLLSNALFSRPLREKSIKELWDTERYYVLGALYKSIRYLSTSAFKQSEDLATQATNLIFLQPNDVDEKELSLTEGIQWVSDLHNIRVQMRFLLSNVIFDVLNRLEELPALSYTSLTIDELLSKAEQVDRFHEMNSLVERATAKLGKKDSVIKPRVSEIKLVKYLLKGYKLKALKK